LARHGTDRVTDVMAKEIGGAQIKVYKGAPHGLYFTHKDQMNKDLREFIG
jgi:hypothetical protein